MKRKHHAFRSANVQKWLKKHKNYVLALTTTIIVFLIVGGAFLTTSIDNTIERTQPSGSGTNTAPELTLEPSPLTGIDVSPERASRPVTAVIVENSPEARPQSGIATAGVVFEASAEGGITRFVLMFQEDIPAVIGPVRSLRPYFNDWIMQFDATAAHVGGSTEALAEIGGLGIKDMNEFAHSGSFWRDSSRYAPHNAYTSGDNLLALQKQLGFESSTFEPLPRKSDAPAEIPTATDISIDISGYTYNPVFTYNKSRNAYERTVAGAPQKDRETGERITPKSVVVLAMDHRVVNDVGHVAITTTGTNTAWVFQDGIVTKGSWSRQGRDGQVSLTDETGGAIKLNRGQTWFTVLPTGNAVAY